MPARAMSSGASPRTERAAQPNVPAGDRRQPHDRVQSRRLPGAVGADQADDLTGRNLERKALDRVHSPVAHAEVVDDEDWFVLTRCAVAAAHSSATGASPR